MPLLIEFVGIPGSGKSTLARAVASRLAELSMRKLGTRELDALVAARFIGQSAWGTLVLALPYGLRHPHYVTSLLTHAITLGSLRSSQRRSATILHRVRAPRALRDVDTAILVPDEWILHESLLARVENGRGWTRHFGHFLDSSLRYSGASVLIVHVSVTIEEAASRLATRGSASYFDSLEHPVLVAALSELDTLTRESVAFLSSRGHSVLQLPSGSPHTQLVVDDIIARLSL